MIRAQLFPKKIACVNMPSSRLHHGLGFDSSNTSIDAEASRLICVAFFFLHALAKVMVLLRPVYGRAVWESLLGLPKFDRFGLSTRTAQPALLTGGAVELHNSQPIEVTP